MLLYDTWTNIKNLIDTHSLSLDYLESDDLYKISVVYEQNTYRTELWSDTSKVSGIDVNQNNTDLQDFEDNYKDISKGVYNQAGIDDSSNQSVEVISQNKQCYKCETVDVDASEGELDLVGIYTEFTILVTGDEDIIVKLNDSNNDEIPLKGGQNIRDIIGADDFELSKIYYKTIGSGLESQFLLWAIK